MHRGKDYVKTAEDGQLQARERGREASRVTNSADTLILNL